MPYVVLADSGRKKVQEISNMTWEEIDSEIASYSPDDLLNQETSLRLGELRIESKPFAVKRLEAQVNVAKRLAARRRGINQ